MRESGGSGNSKRSADRRSTPGALAVLFALTLAVVASSGCRSSNRDPLAQSMVDSRRLAIRGQDAVQTGKYDEAAQLFGRAVEACPVNERARAGHADMLWRRGERTAAIEQMREAVRLSADDAELQVQLGSMQLAVGDVDGARACAAAAVHAQSQLASAWALDGDVARARGKPDEALRSYHRSLACDPSQPRVQSAIVEIYEAEDRPLRALATLDTILEQYPVDQAPPDLVARRGFALQRLGRYDDAVECLAQAWKQGGNSDVALQLAECQKAAGNSASAQLTLQEALRRAPQHAGLQAASQRLQSANARMAARETP